VSADLHAALEATWPPAQAMRAGPWTIRDGQGGGKRVSAVTAAGDWTDADVEQAEAAMHDLRQPPLFMVRAGEAALDQALERRGYRIADPTVFYSAPVDRLAPFPDAMTAFAHWPPLAIVAEIWSDAGIGPARQAVMARVSGPHVALLGRNGDRPAGAAFVALSGDIAMVHAVEVPPALRRQGAARNLLGRAAFWAKEHGALRLALAVTVANSPARALYDSLGMEIGGQYHYRTR
jgi:GNAT superfamily N-acetyltransferase